MAGMRWSKDYGDEKCDKEGDEGGAQSYGAESAECLVRVSPTDFTDGDGGD